MRESSPTLSLLLSMGDGGPCCATSGPTTSSTARAILYNPGDAGQRSVILCEGIPHTLSVPV